MSGAAATGCEFVRIQSDGEYRSVEREVAEEVPVALEFNGVGYAVLMATPSGIEDLVSGFLLSERLQSPNDPVLSVSVTEVDNGIVARANLPADRATSLFERVRHRATDSSCGLCGVENIEQAMRPLPSITSRTDASHSAIFKALEGLRSHQLLNARTGTVHAAALVDPDGHIRLVREDVGRHNAFDKLLGAMRRADASWDGGFALLSSRCSYELVEKAVLADCPLLVTISAPTMLAVKRASEAGLQLKVLARPDSFLETV